LRTFIYFLIGLAFLSFSCESQRARRWFERGREFYDQGLYLEAIQNWEMVLSYAPESKYGDDALHWIGISYYLKLDMPDRAVSAFSRLVNNYPDSGYAPSDQILVAEIFKSQGDYARAIVELYRFLKLFPEEEKLAEVWNRLIICLFEAGEYEAMRNQAKALAERFPGSIWEGNGWFWIGESYYLEGNYSEAMRYFQEYLNKYPEGELAYKAWLGIGASLEDDGQMEQAIELYQNLERRYPQEKVIQLRLESLNKRYERKYSKKPN